MEDGELLRKLRRGDPGALERVVRRYTPYVSAVIRCQMGGMARAEDVEELSANVFVTLWQQRAALKTDHLRGWLGVVARNEARSLLRRLPQPPAPEEDSILVAGEEPETAVLRREQDRFVREAVLAMGQPDREIFLRHYYYNQTCRAIAATLGMTEEAVKARLKRGRAKLKAVIQEGGYDCELEHF